MEEMERREGGARACTSMSTSCIAVADAAGSLNVASGAKSAPSAKPNGQTHVRTHASIAAWCCCSRKALLASPA